MADYEFGEISHDWLSLHMEIPQHFVNNNIISLIGCWRSDEMLWYLHVQLSQS